MEKFRVGDWVTPDKEMLDKDHIFPDDPVRKSIGKTFIVTGTSTYNTISLNEDVGIHGRDGWNGDYWMIDKNYVVTNILNDL